VPAGPLVELVAARHARFPRPSPYSTLFRARAEPEGARFAGLGPEQTGWMSHRDSVTAPPEGARVTAGSPAHARPRAAPSPSRGRTEEHTSELQTRPHTVCRLPLDKKKPVAQ